MRALLRAALFALLATGCGRLNFEARADGATAVGDVPGADAFVGVLFGDQTLEPLVDQHAAGLAEIASFIPSMSGSVTSLSAYYDGGTAGDNAKRLLLGLYSDAGGNPSRLLAMGQIDGPVALSMHQWVRASVPQTPVQSGTVYWIALLCPTQSGAPVFGANFSFRYRYVTSMSGTGPCDPLVTTCTQHGSPGLDALPDPWAFGAVYYPAVNSFFASHD